MQFEKIFSLIERYRPLTGLSSLPFFKCNEQNPDILWFNYHINQTGNLLLFSINTLYTYSHAQDVTEIPLSLKIEVELDAYSEPILAEYEYAEQLECLSAFCTEDALFKLLEQAEPVPLLAVYRAVLHHSTQN